MKTVSISGSLRENVGKKDAKDLRNKEMVPCVIYGGKEQFHFFTDERSFKDIIYTPEVCFIEIELNSKKILSIVQDVQYHPTTDKIIHVDFMELSDKKAIKMNVPVKITGTSPGVLKGGKLDVKFRKILIKSLPANMPESIVVSIDTLDIGDSIKIRNLGSENYQLLQSENTVVVQVLKARGTAATEGETEGAAASTAKK